MRWIPFIAFFLYVYIEISIFIQVAHVLGVLLTLILVIFTSVIGMSLVRNQGFKNFLLMQQKMAAGESPAAEMIKSVSLIIAGLLLILPGFFTDFLGLLLLLPPVNPLTVPVTLDSTPLPPAPPVSPLTTLVTLDSGPLPPAPVSPLTTLVTLDRPPPLAPPVNPLTAPENVTVQLTVAAFVGLSETRVTEVTVTGEATLSEYDRLTLSPVASVTVTVKLNGPVAVGVPFSDPVAASKLKPAGSDPAVTENE